MKVQLEPVLAQEWFFTFGFGHVHPTTGESLANCYVRFFGTAETALEQMTWCFGLQWAHQYKSREAAGVEEFGLREIEA